MPHDLPSRRPKHAPQTRPKNREVEDEMIGEQQREGEPPRPATEDSAAENDGHKSRKID